MSTHKLNKSNVIKFIELWDYLSYEIGNSRLPLNKSALTISELSQDQNSPEFIKELLKQCYIKNHCRNLTSPVNIETILDCLGESAYHLRDNQKDDLMHIELLEEMAWHIVKSYGHLIKIETNSNDKKCKISSIKNHQIRIENSKA